jgi:hypothetical protein
MVLLLLLLLLRRLPWSCLLVENWHQPIAAAAALTAVNARCSSSFGG